MTRAPRNMPVIADWSAYLYQRKLTIFMVALINRRKEGLLLKKSIYSLRQHLYNVLFEYEPVPHQPRFY